MNIVETKDLLGRLAFIERMPPEGGLKLEKHFFRIRAVFLSNDHLPYALCEPAEESSGRNTGGRLEIFSLLKLLLRT